MGATLKTPFQKGGKNLKELFVYRNSNGELDFTEERIDNPITVLDKDSIEIDRINFVDMVTALTLYGDKFIICENCCHPEGHCMWSQDRYNSWNGRCAYQK